MSEESARVLLVQIPRGPNSRALDAWLGMHAEPVCAREVSRLRNVQHNNVLQADPARRRSALISSSAVARGAPELGRWAD